MFLACHSAQSDTERRSFGAVGQFDVAAPSTNAPARRRSSEFWGSHGVDSHTPQRPAIVTSGERYETILEVWGWAEVPGQLPAFGFRCFDKLEVSSADDEPFVVSKSRLTLGSRDERSEAIEALVVRFEPHRLVLRGEFAEDWVGAEMFGLDPGQMTTLAGEGLAAAFLGEAQRSAPNQARIATDH